MKNFSLIILSSLLLNSSLALAGEELGSCKLKGHLTLKGEPVYDTIRERHEDVSLEECQKLAKYFKVQIVEKVYYVCNESHSICNDQKFSLLVNPVKYKFKSQNLRKSEVIDW